MKRIAVFASGNGTNAENLILHFKNSNLAKITLILSNKSNAFVLKRAEKLGIESYVFNRTDFYHSNEVLNLLQSKSIDFIVLAGFLWLVPKNLLAAFPNKIVNIHPALLPKYGGKGMYGMRVHEAVIEAAEQESGITIHFVNENYDEGKYIFQAKCEIDENDTAVDLAKKIHALEYKYFSKIVEQVIKNLE